MKQYMRKLKDILQSQKYMNSLSIKIWVDVEWCDRGNYINIVILIQLLPVFR